MDERYPELQPVAEDTPAGSDIRYEPEFEELQAEIDKLSLPSATTGVDWEKVGTLASDILRTRSKDLLVASYFTVSGVYTGKVEGFRIGLEVFKGILEHYWETLFPARKRMRARIAAVTWLLERSEIAFAAFEPEPCEPDYILSLEKTVAKIDELLGTYLDDAPLLRPLERIIESLPVAERPVDEPEEEVVVVKEQEPQPPVTETGEEASVPAEKKEQVAPPPPKQEERPSTTPVRVEPPPSSGDMSTMSAAEVEKILRQAFKTVRQAGEFYFDKDAANPRGYRCRRIAGWSMIQTLPPANGERTQIAPPGEFEQIKLHLYELRSLEKWQELLGQAEKRFPSALLWLDLNRLSAESLAALGDQYGAAQEAVCQETAALLRRLPGLVKLTFADGSPLADADTRQWAEELTGDSGMAVPVQASLPTGTDTGMEAVLEQAHNLAAAKKVKEAIGLVSREVYGSRPGRDRLLWRMGLLQVMQGCRQLKYGAVHIDEMLSDIDEFKLEEWEPSLALQALKIAWFCYKSDRSRKEQAEVIVMRIARLDPVEAMTLEKM